MTSILDVWRGVDSAARLISGSAALLSRPVRGVARTRAAAPHLPQATDGQLLVFDAALLPDERLDVLLAAIGEAGLEPCGVWLVGESSELEVAGGELPILAGTGTVATVADRVAAYLDHEARTLADVAAELRLAGAEAALADPRPSAPAGVVAARLRRGVAVTVDGALASLNERPAGRALATLFAATHGRLLSGHARDRGDARRTRAGLWIMERAIGPRSSAWLFDDLAFARVDEVALEALTTTLRALLRRQAPEPLRGRGQPKQPPSTGDPLRDTLLAVARANGRIAPAARVLGVHRNTVLYRLRRASDELGIDPRRPDDAIRLMRDSEPRD